MTPERWREVQEIFAAATELAPERRPTYLAQACAHDPELRVEVESLLASLGTTTAGFLESPAIEAVMPERADASRSLPVGALLGPYEVVGLLGSGGMGSVYRARDARLGRDVAVKVLPADPRRGGARMLREARAASALNHPNIVTVYDVGASESGAWIAMERVDGQTLRRRLERGALPLRKALPIAAQVSEGLARAHGAGIVHRDLKPENIMVTSDGLVKILDFGLAKSARPSPSPPTGDFATATATRSGLVVGTAAYMSPEQARGEAVDFRSDQFSLGSILYEMTTGRRAFSEDNEIDTLSAILHDEPPPIASIRPELPAPLQWIIERCLSKERERRYSATDDLARDLATLRDRLPDLASAARPASGGRRAPRPLRRSVGIVVVGAVAAALAAGLILRSGHGVPAPPPQIRARPLTSNTPENAVGSAVISPDGNYVAYADAKGMHILAIDSEESRSVPEPDWLGRASAEWTIGPWLSNSTRFFANARAPGQFPGVTRSQGSSLWVTSILGGAPRKLRDDALVYSASPDGSRIAFGTGRGKFGDREVWTMRPDGQDARIAYRCDDGCALDGFSWLPGTDRVAYIRLDQSGASVLSRDQRGASPATLFSPAEFDRIGDAAWLSGGRLIFTREEPGSRPPAWNFWTERIDPRGGRPLEEPRRLTDWAGFAIGSSTASADGRRLAFVKRNGHLATYVGDVSPDGERIERVRPLTLRSANDLPVDWTPDGKAVILVSDRGGGANGIFRQALDADSADELVPPERGLGWPRLSPDGRWIVYLKLTGEDSKSPKQLYRAPATGGPSVPVFMTRPGTWILHPRSSAPYCMIAEPTADRRTMVVSAFDPVRGRGPELARWDLDPDDDGWSVEVSPDGTRIAMSKTAAGPIQIISTRGEPLRVLTLKDWHSIQSIDWSSDGKFLFVSNAGRGRTELLRVSLDGETKVLWTDRGGGQFVIAIESPDGRRIAMNGAVGEGNVWMMEGF